MAVDGASGRHWLAYSALVTHGSGLYVQALSSAGGPQGAAQRLADTATASVQEQPVPITGRGPGHAGVFAAWQGGEHSNLTWDVYEQRLGGGPATVLHADPNTSPVAIAADPNGRIWVVWEDMNYAGKSFLYYRRSSPSGSSFGPAQAILLPASFQGHYNLYADAQAGRLDVLGPWGPTYQYYEHQIVVKLGLNASVQGDHVDFTVTDQGAPVAGATVRFCGTNLTTGPSGQASFTVTPVTNKATSGKAKSTGASSKSTASNSKSTAGNSKSTAAGAKSTAGKAPAGQTLVSKVTAVANAPTYAGAAISVAANC